ncbi:hypothetical protein [Thermosipho atlanticus]|uniref:Uncharacterized protein n=1 Tax=Thermosipho atlanticus DSM 15807 TaxID=1123380 RepID=A0A1M5RC31_9BACT|nr:hypothetical protein [Thermosipho atlanticus]SHH23892.1 hypothetical protein SAMN02745199_0460 [Thermosipho atlanticus DSM 15807]
MKTPKELLVKEIGSDLINYLKSGTISVNSFLKVLNLNIENLQDLLKIHYILLKDVREYIFSLPELIRKLRVSTNVSKEYSYEGVKGQIDWQDTIKERLKRNYKDRTLYCKNERNKYYNTKENIILKKFLETVYKIIFEEIKMERFTNYEWYRDGKIINGTVKNIYEKNIYMNRINLEDIKITERMLEDVSKNRNILYAKAAKLLKKYYEIVNLKVPIDELKSVFEKTFIEIADENTLFELYWIVKIIKSNASNYKMYIMDDKNNKVATWEDENFTYTIYHNSTGSSELFFNIYLDEVKDLINKNEYITRLTSVINEFSKIRKELFGIRKENNLWNGRPDILLEIRDNKTGEIKKIIIGEVKYTTDQDYMLEGVRQLLEYIHFIKYKDNEYIYKNKQIQIEGFLFVDNIPFNDIDDSLIKIYSIDNKNIKVNV